ncbi:hypothetical protein [Bosea sp. BIWAKO-01]|uniref:hypothetical protein n=1 Tax=Bosea sp. BIWAKO-01 TaxID=506668 RepID=UPI000853C5FC|nr:hypothetical protein [Bosea sp. BIWAKO-01]GAU83304.1 hypothetical protein BIWAKO_03228 [Bosea sp. BIWAKO-01]
MALSLKAIERLLDKSEFQLFARTRRSTIGAASDADLQDLAKQIRERRDRARGIARQQRREMRRKAEPQGARPASDNSGTKAKADALTAALKRVGAERTRRTEKLHAPSQRSLARKALVLKQRQAAAKQQPASRQAGKGMKSVPSSKAGKSGALDHAGQRSAMHRSKFAR